MFFRFWFGFGFEGRELGRGGLEETVQRSPVRTKVLKKIIGYYFIYIYIYIYICYQKKRRRRSFFVV